MAGNKKCLDWILSELPQLRAKGVIAEECADNLERYYREKRNDLPGEQKIFTLLPGLLGVVLIAGGLILFLNHNWEIFPKVLRIGISTVPLLIGAVISFFTLLKNKGTLWKESSAILTATGAAALIAMLSQIYHQNGELHEFLFGVLLLSVPLLYIFNSIGLATLYVFWSCFINNWSSPLWYNSVVLLAFAPYLLYHLSRETSHTVWCRYLALLTALSSILGCPVFYPVLTCGMWSTLFLLCGWDFYLKKTDFFKNPWFSIGFAAQTFLLASGSSTTDIFEKTSSVEFAFPFFWIINALLLILLVMTLFKQHLTLERSIIFLLPAATLPVLLLKNSSYMCLIYNIYLGLTGIILLRSGLKKHSLIICNCGTIMIITLTGCRFFDADIGTLYRSAGFILLGIFFIIINIICTKRARKVKNENQ